MKGWDCRDATDRLIQRIITSAEAALIFQRMAINKITGRNGSTQIWPMYKTEMSGWDQNEDVFNGISYGWVDLPYGSNVFICRVDHIPQNPWEGNKGCKLQHVQAKVTVRCCVWWAAAVNPELCSSWAMPSNHFPGIFQWTSVPIIPPHIFLELFMPWPPAAGPAFEQKTISLPGTGCTMVQEDRG